MNVQPKIRKILAKPKKSIVFALILCLVAAGVIYAYQVSQEKAAVPKNSKATVKKGDIESTIEANGTAELETVELTYEVGGIVKDIPVKVGDKVKAGEVIARLDAEDFQLEQQSKKASVQEAKIKLESAQTNYREAVRSAKEKLETAELEYKPMEEAPELYTQQELKLKKAEVATAQADYQAAVKNTSDIKSAKIAVQQANVSLNQAAESLSDTVLTSPVDGTVLYLDAEVGEKISAGTDSDTAFAVVCVGDSVSVSASINELDIAGVKVGQKAEAEFEAVPDTVFSGKVTEIELMPAENSNGIVTYAVKVLLDKPDVGLKDGMTCTLKVITDEKKDVLLLEKDALRGSGDKKYVELAGAGDKTEKRLVTTGISDDTNIEITGGLKEGDQVIINTGVTGSKTGGETKEEEESQENGMPDGMPGGGMPGGGPGGGGMSSGGSR